MELRHCKKNNTIIPRCESGPSNYRHFLVKKRVPHLLYHVIFVNEIKLF